jgi:hypothetical protein
MKLDNKTSYEVTEEIALTDTELGAVLGGSCGYPAPSTSDCYGGGAPSYGGDYPSSYGSGAPSYGGGAPSYAPQYGNPFDTGNGGTTTTYTVTTTTYSVSPAPAPSSCGGY